MTIELRVPLSPTPSFLHRVVLMAESIRRFHPDTIVRAYIGGDRSLEPQVIATFAGHHIGHEWINAAEFAAWEGTRSPYLATMNRRWKTPVHGTHVIIADADIIFTGPLDALLEVDAVQGVMAHVAPMDDANWRYLFSIAGLRPPLFAHELSGAGVMGPHGQLTPWYANSGMIFAPRRLFETLTEPYHQAIAVMRGAMRDTYWFDQLAVALAVARTGVPAWSLPLRYNFPNQRAFDEAKPDELADVRVLHYLREDVVNRTTDFESLAAMRRFVQRRDLTGSNEVLRRAVAETMGALEPTGLERVEDVPWA